MAAALQRVGGWAAVMTPVTHLQRLVNEDMTRLRVALKCVEAGVASSERDGAHMHPELALDREAERCRQDIDAVLLRMVQHVQATRERLYKEVDEAIVHRRETIARLKDVGHKLTHAIKDVERCASSSSLQLPQRTSSTLIDEEPHVVVEHHHDDNISGLVNAAQLLASMEERLVLDAETALSHVFPPASAVSVTRQLAKRDVIVLPSSSNELALLPFSLRLTKPLAMSSDLDNVHVKDSSGWRVSGISAGGGSRSSSMEGKSQLRDTTTRRITTELSSAELAGENTVAPNSVQNSRRQSWRAFRGLGSVQARRRNIRTPDALLL